jgi:hypothetical protein
MIGMRSCIAITSTLGVMASAACPVFASPLPVRGTFIYSSLCSDPEGSGDLGGYRIKLSRSAKGDSLYLEYNSEGPLYGPTLASALTIDSKTSKMSFTIPANASPNYGLNGAKTYTGTISGEAVILDEDGRAIPREAKEEDLLKLKRCK